MEAKNKGWEKDISDLKKKVKELEIWKTTIKSNPVLEIPKNILDIE